MLTRKEKTVHIDEITEKFSRAKGVVFANYQGLTVIEINQVRGKLAELDVEFKVYKNTLIAKATAKNGITGLEQVLKGATVTAFSYADEAAAARGLKEFTKTISKLEIKGGVLEGVVIDVASVKRLADLPDKDTQIAILLSTLQAPLRGFLTVCNGPVRGLAQVISQIADQKQAS